MIANHTYRYCILRSRSIKVDCVFVMPRLTNFVMRRNLRDGSHKEDNGTLRNELRHLVELKNESALIKCPPKETDVIAVLTERTETDTSR
jgi:hypothetical protein